MGGLNTLTRITGFRKGLGAQESIFSDPFLVGWWKADKRVNNRLLKDMSRHGHHMYFGSAKAAMIIDGALVIPGAGGSYVSTPDSPAISIVGDIDLRLLIAPYSWRSAAAMSPLGKWGAPNNSYWVYIDTTGTPHFVWSTTGADSIDTTATAAVPANSGTTWLRVTLDVDNGSGGHTTTFYTSPDGVTWNVLGAPIVAAGVTSVFDGGTPLVIGSTNTGGSFTFNGSVYYAEIRNGINGPVAAAFDARDKVDGTTTWAGPQGNVWTINSPAVTTNDPQPLDYDTVNGKCAYLPGVSGNTVMTPDQAALDITGDLDIRVKVAPDKWNPAGAGTILAKWGNAGARSFQFYLTTSGGLGLNLSADGTNLTRSPAMGAIAAADGTPMWVRATYNATIGDIRFYTAPGNLINPTVADFTQIASQDGAAIVIFNSTAPVEIGTSVNGASTFLAGRYYKAEVRNGIDGPVVASFDASQWSEPFRYYSPVANLLDKDTSDLEGSLGQWRVDSSGGSATGSVVRVAGVGVGGSAGAQGTVATVGTGTFFLAFAGNGAAGIPVLGGQTVSAMATAIAPTGGGRVIGLSANFFDMSGAYITTLAFQATVPTTGAPQVLSGAAVAPANAAYFFPRVALGAAIVGDVLTVDSGAAFYGALQAWVPGGVPWTANRTTSGRKLAFVDRSVLLFGTDDYLEALDHDDFDVAPGDSFTGVAVYRTYDATSYQVVMSKFASTAGEGGWEMAHSNGSPNVGGGFIDSGGVNASNYSPSNSLSMGVAVLQSLVRNVALDQIQTYLNTSLIFTADTTTATFVNGQVVRIGRRTGSGGNYGDMEFVAAAVFRRSLSAAEIVQVQNELVRVGV